MIATPYRQIQPNQHGIYEIDLESLDRTWAAREGRANIERHWKEIGPVLDVEWLRAHVEELDESALVSLFVDVSAFSGGENFVEQIAILVPYMAYDEQPADLPAALGTPGETT